MNAPDIDIPAVSVVITTRNRVGKLKRAVRSVQNQTCDTFDIHIVDDASEDETPAYGNEMADEHEYIHYWRQEERGGLSAARNLGLRRSNGEFVAYLDDDDEWKEEALGRRMAVLDDLTPGEREKLGVIYCGSEVHLVDENRVTYNMPAIEGDIAEHVRRAGKLSTIPSSCIFPRRALKDIGGFDEGLESCVDHDIWMQLAAGGYSARPVHEALSVTYLSRSKDSMVTDTSPRRRGLEQFLRKWEPVFCEWFGPQEGRRFVAEYRSRVLGGLAVQKLFSGSLGESGRLLRHLIRRNGLLRRANLTLPVRVVRHLVRAATPVWALRLYQSLQKGRI